MNIGAFVQQVSVMHDRLSLLFDNAATTATPSPSLASSILKELGVAMEELQVAMEELQQSNEELTIALIAVEDERKRYQDLFQFAPEAYLVTSVDGCIKEANQAASQMLKVPIQFLIGKPLSIYVRESYRPFFRQELNQRQQRDYFQDWEVPLQSREGEELDALCSTLAIRDHQGALVGFRWIIRDISQSKRITFLERHQNKLDQDDVELLKTYPRHDFMEGDWIPLDHHTIWMVEQGLVKLTTLTSQNQEVLIGLAGPGMFFGAYLTSLSLYEAIVETDVQLIAIPVVEAVASPTLNQLLLSRTRQRLKQVETLLAISAERQIEHRLCQLLNLLKNDIGESTPQGVRLNLRLTHEDLANACCATRVTISRLLHQLMQAGKITLDEKKHIVILRDLQEIP